MKLTKRNTNDDRRQFRNSCYHLHNLYACVLCSFTLNASVDLVSVFFVVVVVATLFCPLSFIKDALAANCCACIVRMRTRFFFLSSFVSFFLNIIHMRMCNVHRSCADDNKICHSTSFVNRIRFFFFFFSFNTTIMWKW